MKDATYSDEAETSLLGNVLLTPESLVHVPTDLRPFHFYSGQHQRIYDAILTVHARGELPTHAVVIDELQKTRRLAQVGIGYDSRIHEVMKACAQRPAATPEQFQAHATLILEMVRRREQLDRLRRVEGGLSGGTLGSADVDAELLSIAAGAPTKSTAPSANPFRALMRPIGERWPEALSTPPTEPNWLIRRGSQENAPGVLRAGKVGFLIAAGGVGKTQALVQLAVAVATGGWWLGAFHAPQPGRVLLALAEEDEEEVRRRLYHAVQLVGLDTKGQRDVLARVVAMPLAGTPVSLVAPGEDGEVRETALFENIHSLLLEETWGLIVLDPLSRWAGHDTEKDNAAATRFIQGVERFTKAPGEPTVLVAHHTPEASRGVNSNAPRARGVTGLTDGARWAATVAEDDVDEVGELPFEVVEFAIVKSNYARKGEPVAVVRETKHLGALRPMRPDERAAYEQACAAREARKRTRRTRGDSAPKSAAPKPKPNIGEAFNDDDY